jgi:hypothetical protein
MDWFTSPKITSCKTKNPLMVACKTKNALIPDEHLLTPIILQLDGWGILRLTAPEYDGKSVFLYPLACRQHEFVLNVPMDTKLVIQVLNLFGLAQQSFQVPTASTLLKTIHAPTAPSFYKPTPEYSLSALGIKGMQPKFWIRRVVFSLNKARIHTPTFFMRHKIRPFIFLPKTVIKSFAFQLNLPELEVKFKPFPLSSIND